MSQRLHGCHNLPRPLPDASYIAQDGWSEAVDGLSGQIIRRPRWVAIKATFGTTDCQYDKSATDTWCTGCHQQKGANP